MKQEDKELLLKDLCARLPYGVICYNTKNNFNFSPSINNNGFRDLQRLSEFDIKSYLRPMSSMTEEENLMYEGLMIGTDNVSYMLDVIDWLNANHFDFRNLIGKGLAIEAPDDMYKID